MSRRVVVTGVGLVSSLGHDLATVVDRLRRGRSGVRAVPAWGDHGLRSRVAGLIDGLDRHPQAETLPKKLAPGMSDAARYCCLAARDAMDDARLDPEDVSDPRTGCIAGSGCAGTGSVHRAGQLYFDGRRRRVDPYTVARCMSSSPSASLANLLGIRGRSYSISSACATSAHNIAHAAELIRAGALDRAFAGGGEDVSELVTLAFDALRTALSTRYNDAPERASRPYDADRDGFVMSGGAGIVVLEALEVARRRGAPIRAEILGIGAGSDGFDVFLPQPEGEGMARCMQMALDDAGLPPDAIDYVNTNATGTVQGDVAEIHGMARVFGPRVPPFSSSKSMTGHGLGAAGALELIFCIGMIEGGFMAPSINVENPDPELAGMPLVTGTTARDLGIVMTSNFGFGGTNASLVLGRVEG